MHRTSKGDWNRDSNIFRKAGEGWSSELMSPFLIFIVAQRTVDSGKRFLNSSVRLRIVSSISISTKSKELFFSTSGRFSKSSAVSRRIKELILSLILDLYRSTSYNLRVIRDPT